MHKRRLNKQTYLKIRMQRNCFSIFRASIDSRMRELMLRVWVHVVFFLSLWFDDCICIQLINKLITIFSAAALLVFQLKSGEMNHSIIERRRNLDKITDFHLPICGNRLDLRVERGRFNFSSPKCHTYLHARNILFKL